jgi:hypothetical protein
LICNQLVKHISVHVTFNLAKSQQVLLDKALTKTLRPSVTVAVSSTSKQKTKKLRSPNLAFTFRTTYITGYVRFAIAINRARIYDLPCIIMRPSLTCLRNSKKKISVASSVSCVGPQSVVGEQPGRPTSQAGFIVKYSSTPKRYVHVNLIRDNCLILTLHNISS